MDRKEQIEKAASLLLPPDVSFAACAHESAPPCRAEEERNLAAMAPIRRRAFDAGREAARLALLGAGASAPPPVPPGAHRSPEWPRGFVGSISHGEGISIACAARVADRRGLGLDLERSRAVEPALWDTLFVPTERRRLEALDAEAALTQATLWFSAKESLFKLQFPVTQRFLEFTEAELESSGSVLHGRLPAEVHARLGHPGPLEVLCAATEQFVLTFALLGP